MAATEGLGALRRGVYGPVIGRTRAEHGRTVARPEVDLRAGACAGLPARVVERYFGAHAYRSPFEVATARAICARCPVLVDCLADGIATAERWPRVVSWRAGVSVWALAALHAELLRSRVPARRLAVRELRRMGPALGGAHGHVALREGRFSSPELLP